MSKKLVIAAAILVLIVIAVFMARRGPVAPALLPVQDVPLVPVPPVETPKPTPVPKKKAEVPAAVPPAAPPPPVTIHKELIPKDIEIVRVYYASQITGPGTEIEFDINGSGFTTEFEKMITVDPGNPDVVIKNLKLITLNQIHGTLVIGAKTATAISFPQVLIQQKVVFRAAEPFAVIRPGDVLNVILTEMGENGRTGRVRVFTNLTPDTFSLFRIEASTPTIQIVDVIPTLPYVVDATIDTGMQGGSGDYDLRVKLGAVTVFERKGFVRIVRPNVGQSGLAQQIRALDGFHRPGDVAKFIVMGSGFLPEDATRIMARVTAFPKLASNFTYVGPGKMEFQFTIPAEANPGAYSLDLLSDETTLLNSPNLFTVVGVNWARALEVTPALLPGGKSKLALLGRALEKKFVEEIKIEVDEPSLKVGAFKWGSAERAEADIEAGDALAPGDYLLKLTHNGQVVSPAFGSIVRVDKKQP